MTKELQKPHICFINLHFTTSVVTYITIGTYIPSFAFLSSVVLSLRWYVSNPQFAPWNIFWKNHFLGVTYVVIGSYIPNFKFLASVVRALHWYVSNPYFTLRGTIYDKSFLAGYIHHNSNLLTKYCLFLATVILALCWYASQFLLYKIDEFCGITIYI